MKKKAFAERTQSHDWAVSIPGVRSLQRIGSRRRHESTSAVLSKKNKIQHDQDHPPPPIPVNLNAIRVARISSSKTPSCSAGVPTSTTSLAMKDDSRFEKYWNMKVLGIPDSTILNYIRKDGHETSIWYLDWNKNYEEQQSSQEPRHQQTRKQQSQTIERQPKDSQRSSSSRRDDAVPPVTKKDSRLEKCCNVKVVGLSDDAISSSAICLDGQDDSTTCDDFPIMKDDPRFDKYWKMKVVGVPDGAIRNAIRRDGEKESIWDLDWDKNYESQMAKLQESRIIHAVKANESRIQPAKSYRTPMKEDSRFQKYWKMKSVGVPDGAILNAIARDGLDTSIWNMDRDRNYEEQLASPQTEKPPKKKKSIRSSTSSRPVPMKKDSRFDRYWKMKAVGVPTGAIQNAMRRDGWDASVLFEKKAWEKNYESQLLSSQTKKEEEPGIWGLKATLSGLSSKSTKSTGRSGWLNPWACTSPVLPNDVRRKDPTIRRKKIFWRPIDPRHIKENSLWSLVQSKSISLLSFDSKEFNELFTEPIANTNQQQRNKNRIASVADVKPKPKGAVQVIDVKRSMNGGIVLARLRLEYEKIATIINNMEHGHFDATQLKALKEFLPTDEERHLLQMYMCREEVAFSYLSECEKYMFTMMHVAGANNKLDCMLFREQFSSRFNDLVTSIQTLERACDEVKNSESLREILGIILIVVNRMNTGGVGKRAAGFSLEALLKLNETKAFDKKTSVLQYLVKLVKRNNESLLDFYKDLSHVGQAKNIVIDSLFTEIRDLKKEIEAVHKTAQKHTDQLSGEESKFTLKRIMQQITPLRSLSGVTHYNQIDHVTERMCPMERFTVNAASSTETAFIMAQDVKKKYANLLEYLGEAEEMASNDCFGTMERFITEFCRAAEQLQKDEKAMMYKIKRAANKVNNFLSQNGKVKRKDQITDKITVIDLSPMGIGKEDNQWEENSLLETCSAE